MKKKLITISEDLYQKIKRNAEASELTIMEEIRQTLKAGVKYRKKALGVPESINRRSTHTPKANKIIDEKTKENTVFLDDLTEEDIKDTVTAAKQAFNL